MLKDYEQLRGRMATHLVSNVMKEGSPAGGHHGRAAGSCEQLESLTQLCHAVSRHLGVALRTEGHRIDAAVKAGLVVRPCSILG